MAAANTGRFVWYELFTTDVKAATAFYGEVAGWKTEPFGDDYLMWTGSQGPLGGVMSLNDAMKAMGVPPNWMSHVEVADVDASVETVRRLGAKVIMGPHEVPTVGRFAVIADPQGAVISVFKPAQAMASHDPTKHGEFTWRELVTTDLDAAFAFYRELLGWEKLDDHDIGPMGTYRIFGRDGQRLGGMFVRPPAMTMPPAWLYYVHVDDLEAAIARATAQGAKVLNGPMSVPDGARIAQLLDPQGAAFALHADGPAK